MSSAFISAFNHDCLMSTGMLREAMLCYITCMSCYAMLFKTGDYKCCLKHMFFLQWQNCFQFHSW